MMLRLKKISLSNLLFYVFITTILMLEITLSKYHSTLGSTNVTNVAKWSNGIELLSEESLILSNGNTNSESIKFNVLSDSEVESVFDVTFVGIPWNIGIRLQNEFNQIKCVVSDNNLIVSYLVDGVEEEITFDISKTSETVSIGAGNISITSEVIDEQQSIVLIPDFSDTWLKVLIDDNVDNVTVIYEDFGVIDSKETTMEHTVTFETAAVELPSMGEVEFYATFEQID